MKHGKCPKCNTITWLVEHHIYPQAKFKENNNETIHICSNCHVDLHQKMGKIESDDPEFYKHFHIQWLWGAIIAILISTIVFINFL